MTSPSELQSTTLQFVSIDVGFEGNPIAILKTGELFMSKSGAPWSSMNATMKDFSTGLPNEIFPRGQLWLVAQNGDADGEVYSVDFETGHQNDTYGKASLISSADDGEAWAIQSNSEAMRWDSSTQKWIGNQGAFTQIAVSNSSLQWGLSVPSPTSPQALMVREADTGEWVTVASSPEAGVDISQIATNSAGDLVCVTTDHKVFHYLTGDSVWVQLGGDDIAVQSISIRDPKNAWLIDTDGNPQALGPLLDPVDHFGQLEWDTEDVWDETRSTHLYLVNRAAQLVGTCSDSQAFQNFVQHYIQPMVGQAGAGRFRQGLCQGLYDADFLPDYNNPFLGRATWKSHFYDPANGLNWMKESEPTALTNGVEFWKQSVDFMNASAPDLYKGGYALGLALHYFTDLTQPMHAANYTWQDSLPPGYHTDFEVYTMSQQALLNPQPKVVGFVPGPVDDIAALYVSTATHSKDTYFNAIDQAHKYLSWKFFPAQWQAAVLRLLPAILNDSVSATSQMLYLYIKQLVPLEDLEPEAVSAQS